MNNPQLTYYDLGEEVYQQYHDYFSARRLGINSFTLSLYLSYRLSGMP